MGHGETHPHQLANPSTPSTLTPAGPAGDGGVVTLAEGANVIHVHVISADRTVSNTYTVTVTRAAD